MGSHVFGRRDLGRDTTAVTGKEMAIDAVGMVRWPERAEAGAGTRLSDGGGGKNGPGSKKEV